MGISILLEASFASLSANLLPVVSTYVCMYVRTYVRMYVCMCVFMYVCMSYRFQIQSEFE